MHSASPNDPTPASRPGLRWPAVVLMVLLTMVISAGLGGWLLSRYLFPAPFHPVQLKPQETQVLADKLRALGVTPPEQPARAAAPPLQAEPYSETGARREVSFSERELNAMLAHNTDLAQKLAIDLADDLISAKLLLPLEQDLPLFGGKTLRVHAGVELAYRNRRPVVVLKGVSIMGVPLPNAWLGQWKNVDLVNEFGGAPGFWSSLAEGVDDIRVEDGRLWVKLKE
ncbi:MAG: arginine N-succinyltransferase [Gammaproteobacteria bacterium]